MLHRYNRAHHSVAFLKAVLRLRKQVLVCFCAWFSYFATLVRVNYSGLIRHISITVGILVALYVAHLEVTLWLVQDVFAVKSGFVKSFETIQPDLLIGHT